MVIRRKSKIRLLIFIGCLAFECSSTDTSTTASNSHDSLSTEYLKDSLISAKFPGGAEMMMAFIKKNMIWRQNQYTISGSILASFLITKNGEIRDIKIEKSLCESCDKEAVRIIESMPRWIPAKKDGLNIESRVVIPIEFKLYSEN
jgi:TonB family protein